jgi:S-adenosylmethionine/arginine decarboxylase-like enzyme
MNMHSFSQSPDKDALVLFVSFEAEGDFSDSTACWQSFLTIVNRLPATTVINSIKHDFPGGGMSGLILLAESHAAVHTWPEYSRAYFELATCSGAVAAVEFVNMMKLHGFSVDFKTLLTNAFIVQEEK